jgi:hypothetical protein
MSSRYQAAVERFLVEHHPELAELTLRAYTAAGGHYLALSEAARRQHALGDAGEFATALQTKLIDYERVGRLVTEGGTQALLEDIVRMVRMQEHLFVQFVQAALPEQPELAHELQQRARQLAARFCMALTAAGMTAVVHAARPSRESGSEPEASTQPRPLSDPSH